MGVKKKALSGLFIIKFSFASQHHVSGGPPIWHQVRQLQYLKRSLLGACCASEAQKETSRQRRQHRSTDKLTHTHTHKLVHISCVALTSTKHCDSLNSQRDTHPSCLSKNRKMARSLFGTQLYSHYVVRTECYRDFGGGGCCQDLSRGQKHGTVIIKALIQINREQMKRGGRRTHRKYPVWLCDIDNMSVDNTHISTFQGCGGTEKNRVSIVVCVCVFSI